MYNDENEETSEPTPVLAMLIEMISQFLSRLIKITSPILTKAKTLTCNILILIRNDRMAACTTAICLTILICTGIICSKLSSIYWAIPSSSVSDYETHSKLDSIENKLRSIDNNISNMRSY